MNIETVKGVLEVLDGDTRNAMHSILGFLELIAEGELDQAQRKFVEACRAAAEQQCRGIDDARLVLGLIHGERQVIADFDPQEFFSGIADVIGAMAQRKGVGLFSKVASDVPSLVSGDADRIGHALLRVADGVVSSLDGGDLHLNLGAFASPDGFNLTFEIFAPGSILPPVLILALQQDEFEFDGPSSNSDALGMAAARKLATAFAGRLDALADPSTGTRIVITIVVGAPSGVPRHPRSGQPRAPGAERALRILVAEDSDASFQLFQAYLQGGPIRWRAPPTAPRRWSLQAWGPSTCFLWTFPCR